MANSRMDESMHLFRWQLFPCRFDDAVPPDPHCHRFRGRSSQGDPKQVQETDPNNTFK